MKQLWHLLHHSDHVFAQVIRYGLTGGFVTLIAAGIYWVLADPVGINPQLANVISWLFAVGTGYMIHSRWSFKGHGSTASEATITARFLIVALIGLGINSFWVQLMIGWLRGPDWWPVPLLVFVTPVLVFPLNRYWVFR
jgi:putative flippase GtrA